MIISLLFPQKRSIISHTKNRYFIRCVPVLINTNLTKIFSHFVDSWLLPSVIFASGSHTAWPHRGGQNPLSNTLCRYRNSSLRDTTTINCPCKNTTGWRSCMCHLHANMTSIRRSRKNQKRVNKSYAESKSKFTERPVWFKVVTEIDYL